MTTDIAGGSRAVHRTTRSAWPLEPTETAGRATYTLRGPPAGGDKGEGSGAIDPPRSPRDG